MEHYAELQQLATQLQIPKEQIRFLRSISIKKRNNLLNKCVAVLYTPQFEHFGNKNLYSLLFYFIC